MMHAHNIAYDWGTHSERAVGRPCNAAAHRRVKQRDAPTQIVKLCAQSSDECGWYCSAQNDDSAVQKSFCAVALTK